MSDSVNDFIQTAMADPDYWLDQRAADYEHHLEQEEQKKRMNTPTPADAFRAVAKAAEKTAETLNAVGSSVTDKLPEKKPFERPEHLMHRPFQQSEELRKLQSKMNRKTNKVINPKAKRQR